MVNNGVGIPVTSVNLFYHYTARTLDVYIVGFVGSPVEKSYQLTPGQVQRYIVLLLSQGHNVRYLALP